MVWFYFLYESFVTLVFLLISELCLFDLWMDARNLVYYYILSFSNLYLDFATFNVFVLQDRCKDTSVLS